MDNEVVRSGARRWNPAYVEAIPQPTGALQYTVNEAGIELIERMARNGHAQVTIAKELGIHALTLREVRKRQPDVQEALQAGIGGLQDELVSSLLKQAREGNTVAAIYLSKSMCGLRDVGPTTPDAGAGPAINITINAPMSDAEWQKMITVDKESGE
jgi:hypothetical protein